MSARDTSGHTPVRPVEQTGLLALGPGSKSNERVDSAPLVFPDTVSLRLNVSLPEGVVRTLSKYCSTWDADGAFVRESGFDAHLYGQSTDERARIAGSLSNWAVQNGVLPVDDEFGLDETARTFDALEVRFGLAPGTLYDTRVDLPAR